MILAPFSITADRQKVIQFSKPFMFTGVTILMKLEETQSRKELLSFMDPYMNEVWLMILSATILVGCTLFFCDRLSSFGHYGRVVQKRTINKGTPLSPTIIKNCF